MKMSWRRGKTSGWAAFDLKQRRKLGLDTEAKDEDFPSVSGLMLTNNENVALVEKPFASVLLCSVNYPTLKDNANLEEKKKPASSSSVSNRTSEFVSESSGETSALRAREMLKEQHSWAAGSLIEDVLAGVNYDLDKASTLLKGMVSSDKNYKDNKDSETRELRCNSEESLPVRDKLSADMTTDLAELTRLIEEGLKCNDADDEDGDKHVSDLKKIQKSVKFLPVEPEWEEDDIYFVHRKEALRMMRSALRHSKAANDAYFRGDHLSAQQHSLKAREEWMVAKRLNDMAASEILSIRNSKNDKWTLDLHGLHAMEAVKALQEHLLKIEAQVSMDKLACASVSKEKSDIIVSAHSVSASCNDAEKFGRQISTSKPRPTSLQVITGKGNHSRGEAALPLAVRSFLSENGYYYYETRPGVITVRLKFRR